MILWRISRFHDLTGCGAQRASARWNLAGPPMVYTSDSPAAALLEVCVHIVSDDVPTTYELLRIVGPDINPENVRALPPDWTDLIDLTQSIGSEWLNSGRTALLRVPSVLAPETWNFLLNPLHPEAALFQIERVYEYPFDLRLKH